MKIREINRRHSRSPKYSIFSHLMLLLCRGRQRNVQRFITHVHSHCASHYTYCLVMVSFRWRRSVLSYSSYCKKGRFKHCTTYGISWGKTSASILMDSVLGLAVGAAARRIFNMAIWKGNNTFVTLSTTVELWIKRQRSVSARGHGMTKGSNGVKGTRETGARK